MPDSLLWDGRNITIIISKNKKGEHKITQPDLHETDSTEYERVHILFGRSLPQLVLKVLLSSVLCPSTKKLIKTVLYTPGTVQIVMDFR